MTWKITKSPGGFNVNREDGRNIAHIKTNGKHWLVSFHDAPSLDWAGGISTESIVGYVRGVERAVQVYGNEISTP